MLPKVGQATDVDRMERACADPSRYTDPWPNNREYFSRIAFQVVQDSY